MLDFFDSLVNFFELIWEFITNIIDSTITLLTVVAQAVSLPAFLLGYVPGIIGSCVLAVAALGIVKLILGWGNK